MNTKSMMLRAITFCLCSFMASQGFAQNGGPVLTVVVNDVEEQKGKIGFQVMDTEQNVLFQDWVPVKESSVSTTFTLESSGKYAVRFFHDVNDNGEMDFYWYGPPKESYGNSNDVQGFMGPPDFQQTIFQVDSDMVMTMKIL